MNTIYGSAPARLAACLLTMALVNLWSQPVWADTRQDALSELSRLRQSASDRNSSDELRSIAATFAIAEHYFQTNDFEQSEQFYLLTIQKARIILASSSKTPADATLSPVTLPLPPAAESQPVPAAMPEPSAGTQELNTPSPESDDEYFSAAVTSGKLVGTTRTYAVVKGDTIRLVAAKLGVSGQQLVKANKLDDQAYLKIGQKLLYNNRKIVPQRMKNGIVVNIPDRTLYYFKKGKLALSLPVAVGVAVKSEKYDWETPTGKFKITAKLKDPTWYVPPSIRSEMEDHGKETIISIPPGASNPLGKYAIKTSIPGILIHSTTKPWSIYRFASHGCIRVYPEQMEEFFKAVKVNTPGEIIYQPVKLAVTVEGRVFLEVHQDVYGKSSGLAMEARRLIEKQNLSGRVDWQKVESMVRHTSGIAEDISL